MNTAVYEHDKLARIVAKELGQEGYAVVFEPAADRLPFSLEGYSPDLLATKADDNVIVEINRRQRKPPEVLKRYRRVVDIVQAHPGWRFLVKTCSDSTRDDRITDAGLSDFEAIEAYFRKAQGVMDSASPEFAIPHLWNAIIALLRRKGRTALPQSSVLTDRSLINQLYTLGEVSSEDYEVLRRWEVLRDHAVHDLGFVDDGGEVSAMLSFARRLLADLRN